MKRFYKNFYKTIIASAMVCLCIPQSYGVVAKPGVIHAEQPDGSVIKIRLEGGPRSHQAFSEDGYRLVNDMNGYYVFADLDKDGQLIPSNIREINVNERSAESMARIQSFDAKIKAYGEIQNTAPNKNLAKGPGLFDTSFPSYGEQKAIAILVQFTNKSFTIDNPHDYFYRMLNEENFSDYGATGSAKDYFVSNSAGQFVPDFDVYGPVTLPNTYAYYGANDWWGNDQHPEEMAIHACQILDDEVDFSQYDRDGDGMVDNIYIFYAGYGEADGGASNTVWPHSWDITSATSVPYIFDGVRINHYACSNEMQYYGNVPDGIGTFVHEFCHVLGLPDLYATSYTSAFTPGSYEVLDSGSYNNNSRTPPNLSAFSRYALDWMIPTPLTEKNVELEPISESNKAYIVKTEKENEYFLIENRQKQGSDAYIPGHGMLVWHIDYVPSVWRSNTVNNNASHQYVDLEEADNRKTESTRAGDAFPGTSNIREISGQTTPGFVTWSNKKLPVRIFDIAESSDGIISFQAEGPDIIDESQFGDASIEGEWKFNIDSHYAGEWSLGEKEFIYSATLDGNTVTFNDEFEEFPMIAVFTAPNTLTFSQTIVGIPAAYTLSQFPFTDGSNVQDTAIDPENFVFGSFEAIYDPENGTLSFPAGCGIAYGYANDLGEAAYYTEAFDLISASKNNTSGGEDPGETDYSNPEIVGNWDITINGTYVGNDSMGLKTLKYISSLKGNQVTFMDEWEDMPIVAVFTAENTLTFKQERIGDPNAAYSLTQFPYTDGSKVENVGINPQDFVFGSFEAIFDPAKGTITFPEGCGIAYGYADNEGNISEYIDAYDLISAIMPKGGDNPGTDEITGTMSASIGSVNLHWNVTASVAEGQVRISNFAGMNPVVFYYDVNGETGGVSSEKDVIAWTDRVQNDGEITAINYFYGDVANNEMILYGTISNINEDQCQIIVNDWGTGTYVNGQPNFIDTYKNTIIVLDVNIPGLPDETGTGIGSIENSISNEIIYYDLSGRRIDHPQKGIYIRKTGDKVEKIILN